MQVIQHQELASAQASITFSSIPQTFTDLCLVLSLRSERSGQIRDDSFLQLNALTTGYSFRFLRGTGSSTSSNSGTYYAYLSQVPGATATSSTFSNISVYLPNYTSGSAKSLSSDGVMENNATESHQDIVANLNTTTDPITSLTIFAGSANLSQYSSATLYGVLKGSDGVTTVS
jgi:hypothetical protein